MVFVAWLIAGFVLAGTSSAYSLQGAARLNSWRCLVPPIEPCFMHRGRLSSQNGIAYMLWLVGSSRIVRVDDTQIPTMLDKHLEMASPNHRDVFGDFEICRLEPDRPGQMRSACIAGAKRLVVQDRGRTRPPIRLLSTWPVGATD